MLKVFYRQFPRCSCKGVQDFRQVNGAASKSFRLMSSLSRPINNKTGFVVSTFGQMSSCHGRSVLFSSKDCSARVLVQKSFPFSTQSSAKGQKKTSEEQCKKNSAPDKASGDSESDKEKVSETHHQVNDIDQIDKLLDVDAEMLRYDYEEFDLTDDRNIVPEVKEKPKKKLPFQQQRGQSGVFDLDELCALLRNDNARDICAISISPELKYVDYLVLATGRSTRHLLAMAEYIQWAYKQKRAKSDPESVKLEGQLTTDWFALDLGNIAVHLMLDKTRMTYDLEQLWAVGPAFDEQTRARSLDDVNAAASLEEFSFDVELERLRKVRLEEVEEKSSKTEPKRKQNKRTIKKETMDSLSTWHGAN